MAKAYLILNASGKIIASHTWGGETEAACPIVPEPGGAVISMKAAAVDLVVSLMVGGQTVSIIGDELMVNGEQIGNIVDGEVVLLA